MDSGRRQGLREKTIAWLARRRIDWRFAVRVTLAAGLSYGIADLLHLSEPFWAAITAVIVARSNLGGSLRSGVDRLLATLAGAGLGVVVAFARPLGIPDLALLIAVVAPLAVLAAMRPEFRAGLVAGVIVLHASAISGSPVGAALLRVVDIAQGAVVAILVARFVLPTSAMQTCHDYSGRALKHLSDLLALVVRPSDAVSRNQIDRVSNHARRAWRAAGRAANEAQAERIAGKPAGAAPFGLVRELSRVHSDIGVMGRMLHHALSAEAAQQAAGTLHRVSREFRALADAAGRALVHGDPVPTIAALDAALAEVPLPAAGVELAALIQMLRILRGDLANLLLWWRSNGQRRHRPCPLRDAGCGSVCYRKSSGICASSLVT